MSELRTIEIDFDVHKIIELERTGFLRNAERSVAATAEGERTLAHKAHHGTRWATLVG